MKQKNRTKKMKLITSSAPMSFMSLAPISKPTGTDRLERPSNHNEQPDQNEVV
jgi:hypothetical protein